MVDDPNNAVDSNGLLNSILKVQQQQEQMMEKQNQMFDQLMEKQNQMFDQFKHVVLQLQQVVQSMIPAQNKPTTTQHIPEPAPPQQPIYTHQSPPRHRSRSPHESRSPRRSRTSGESPSSQSTSPLQSITPPRQLSQRTAQSPVAVVRPLRPESENVDNANAARGGPAANTGGDNRGRAANTSGDNRGRAAQTGGNNRNRAANTGNDNRGRSSYHTRYVWYRLRR